MQLALVHILAFLHLNVVVTGFQMSATGRWDGWIAAASVAAVGLLTVLAAVRALGVVEGGKQREEPPR